MSHWKQSWSASDDAFSQLQHESQVAHARLRELQKVLVEMQVVSPPSNIESYRTRPFVSNRSLRLLAAALLQ